MKLFSVIKSLQLKNLERKEIVEVELFPGKVVVSSGFCVVGGLGGDVSGKVGGGGVGSWVVSLVVIVVVSSIVARSVITGVSFSTKLEHFLTEHFPFLQRTY